MSTAELAKLRAIVVATLTVAASCVALFAEADEAKPTARLSWVRMPGAESCLDDVAVRKDVSTRLGRDAFAAPETLAIEGVVLREPKRWIARLWVRDPGGALVGSRELTSEAESCASLGQAVGLAVALAIDPEAAMGPPPSASPSPSPAAPPSPSPAPSPKPKRPPPPPMASPNVATSVAPPRDEAAVSAGVALAAGLLPRPAPGAVLVFDPAIGALRPVISATYFPPQRVSGGGIGVGATLGGLALCRAVAGTRAFGVDACAGALIGATHAVVYTLEPTDPGDRFWAGIAFGMRLHARLVSGLFLSGTAEGVAPITRHRFSAAGSLDALFLQPGFGIVTTAALGWEFR